MALNDHAEKLRQADVWLATEPVGSIQYQAAMEHLGATEIASFGQVVPLEMLEMARLDLTEHTLRRLRQQLDASLAEKKLLPVALPRYEVAEHNDPSAPFYGLARFNMFVPVRKVAGQ
jgi:hypothetical protein